MHRDEHNDRAAVREHEGEGVDVGARVDAAPRLRLPRHDRAAMSSCLPLYANILAGIEG